jgi:DNA polymerase-3 subunit alpha
MKANFPVDYMAALLTADAGNVDKIGEVIAECKRMGIAILPPSVNESRGTFTVVDEKTIRFGLYSIKNFGWGVADSIIAAHTNAPFKDVADFISRVPDKNLNKKSFESLIQSGALDELAERGRLLANIDMLLNYHRDHFKAPTDQGSLFGAEALGPKTTTLRLEDAEEATLEQKLTWEKELLGVYVSGHPLDKHREKLSRAKMDIRTGKEKFPRGAECVIAGFIETVKPIMTKNGERMVFARLADFSDSVEAVAFPRVLKENDSLFSAGSCIMVKGKFSNRNGEASFVVERARAL